VRITVKLEERECSVTVDSFNSFNTMVNGTLLLPDFVKPSSSVSSFSGARRQQDVQLVEMVASSC